MNNTPRRYQGIDLYFIKEMEKYLRSKEVCEDLHDTTEREISSIPTLAYYGQVGSDKKLAKGRPSKFSNQF